MARQPRILVVNVDEAFVFSSPEAAQLWLEPWALEELLIVVDESEAPYEAGVEGLRVVLSKAGSADLDEVRARLGATGEVALSKAIDDYLRRYPGQMVSYRPLKAPRFQAWGVTHPWVFASIYGLVVAVIIAAMLRIVGAEPAEIAVFTAIGGFGSFGFVGWNFSRGPGYRNTRRRLDESK